jgi:hypothetical protein
MRCQSCDCNLTDEESVRKSKVTDEYLDLCNSCLSTIDEFVEYIPAHKFDPNDINNGEENEADYDDGSERRTPCG